MKSSRHGIRGLGILFAGALLCSCFVSSATATDVSKLPSIVSPPVLLQGSSSGSPVKGGTLHQGGSVFVTPGVWTNKPSNFRYQWQRCSPTSCTSIAGATSRGLQLSYADAGMTMRVIVSASNTYGSASTVSDKSGQVLGDRPDSGKPPYITGKAQDGSTLTATSGSWSNSPTSYRYSLQLCDKTGSRCITASTSVSNTPKTPSYVLLGSDIGYYMRVVVAASNRWGTNTASSSLTSVVLPLNTGLPQITGALRAGSTLSATAGKWNGATNLIYSYKWLRCFKSSVGSCNPVGKNARTYVLTSADVKATIRVQVTAARLDASVIATSVPTVTISLASP